MFRFCSMLWLIFDLSFFDSNWFDWSTCSLALTFYQVKYKFTNGHSVNLCTLYPIWLFGCSHYLNFNSQTHEDIDILKMVFKAKFQKKLNGKIRSCRGGPNFVWFFKYILWENNFDQQLKNTQNWVFHGKIWLCHSISFEILL